MLLFLPPKQEVRLFPLKASTQDKATSSAKSPLGSGGPT